MNNKKIASTLIASIGIFSALSMPAIANADWSIVGLGTYGFDSSVASDINDKGQIVGLTNAGRGTSFLIDSSTFEVTDLGNFGAANVLIQGFNELGQVVGNSEQGAFATGANGQGVTYIDRAFSGGINDVGQIATDDYNKAYITTVDDMGNASSNLIAEQPVIAVEDINNSGQVVGSFVDANHVTHSFVTGSNGQGITLLGNFGSGDTLQSANSINDLGQVAGTAGYAVGLSVHAVHAFVTGLDGTMIDLGTFGGHSSYAKDINELGEVVGYANTADGAFHGFLYSHGGMTDLSMLDNVISAGWQTLSPLAINNHGQIVGSGINSYGITEAFLLSYTPDTQFNPSPILIPAPPLPVPEPSTYLMLLAGLGLVGVVGIRKNNLNL